jgi:hypothetical protein
MIFNINSTPERLSVLHSGYLCIMIPPWAVQLKDIKNEFRVNRSTGF